MTLVQGLSWDFLEQQIEIMNPNFQVEIYEKNALWLVRVATMINIIDHWSIINLLLNSRYYWKWLVI